MWSPASGDMSVMIGLHKLNFELLFIIFHFTLELL